MPTSPKETSRAVLEVVPTIMRAIRGEMRAYSAAHLSVPQFRALNFVQHHLDASLSDVAEHIGLSLPAMSKLMDGLVARKLVTRQIHHADRRRITLALTARGRALWQSAHDATQQSLAERFVALTERDRAVIINAMRLLQPLFGRKRNDERHDESSA